jgi:hypothetical protein
MSLAYYITSVRLWIDKLSEGEIDLDDLIDVADSDTSPGACFAAGVPARDCADGLLEEAGFYSFDFPPEDFLVGYDSDGRPIGG